MKRYEDLEKDADLIISDASERMNDGMDQHSRIEQEM